MKEASQDTSAESFIRFWDYVSGRGLMKINTARSLAASSRQVLSVEKRWEELDITSLDVDGLIDRFKNLRARDYKPETLNIYGRRFRRALGLYLEYLEDPSGWKPVAQRGGGRELKQGAETGSMKMGAAFEPRFMDSSSKLMSYPFPLREDCIVHLRLPGDLSAKDVTRLTSFLEALVIDRDPAN
jgi:hypothetical protein